MAYLRLRLGVRRANFGIGEMLQTGWSASWDVSMGWGESVALSIGTDLAEVRGGLHIRTGAETDGKAPIGALHFFEESEASSDGVIEARPKSYSVEIVVPEERLLTLLQMTNDWTGPVGVSVSVPDLKYGWGPRR
jgi:hypothetical protein